MNSMTYKIKYLPLAVQDLNEIARYLSGFYPKTASRVLKELRDKIAKLGDNPKMCEIYPLDPVYRQMVVDQYLVFYQVNESTRTVEIHRVLRGRGICHSIRNKRFGFECCGECSTTSPDHSVWGFFVVAAQDSNRAALRFPACKFHFIGAVLSLAGVIYSA